VVTKRERLLWKVVLTVPGDGAGAAGLTTIKAGSSDMGCVVATTGAQAERANRVASARMDTVVAPVPRVSLGYGRAILDVEDPVVEAGTEVRRYFECRKVPEGCGPSFQDLGIPTTTRTGGAVLLCGLRCLIVGQPIEVVRKTSEILLTIHLLHSAPW
jgi:hypothetical protein